jgi:hypothetical protein
MTGRNGLVDVPLGNRLCYCFCGNLDFFHGEAVASEVASLLQAKALKEDKRWDAFNERLHALEAILFEIKSLLMTRSNFTAETK